MNRESLSPEQIHRFKDDGFLIVPQLFKPDEMDIVRETAKQDQAFKKNAHDLKDTEGGVAKLVLWNEAGNDVFGAVARSPRLVDAMEQLHRHPIGK